MKNIILILLSILSVNGIMAQASLLNNVSENTTVNGIVTAQSEDNCFETIENLSVANDENALINSGESSIFLASNSIIFGPGFKAVTGSYMHAFISENYCPELPESIVANESGYNNGISDHSNDSQSMLGENDIRIYPNPTNGKFYIDFLNHPLENAELFLFDFRGQKIQNFITIDRDKIEMDLSYLPKGTYLILIRDSQQVIKRKIIKS